MHIKQLLTNEEKHSRFIAVFNLYRSNGAIEEVKDFCDQIEYSNPTLWTVLSGKRIAPNNLIYKFCEFFKLDPAYFFGRSKELKTWKQVVHSELKNELKKVIDKY